MNRLIKTLAFFVLLAMSFSWINCSDDNNPLSPNSLAGTWNLVSMTDKTSNTTFNAGEPIDVGQGVMITMTGSLVLTENQFTFTTTTVISVPGSADSTKVEIDTGTYSVSGSTMTTNSGNSGENRSMTISRNDNRMTLEDNEIRMILDKQ